MQFSRSQGRFAVLITIGVLIGIGSCCVVYWLFIAPGIGDQLADAVAPPSSTQIESTAQVQTSSAEVPGVPEPPKFAIRSLDEIASLKSASEQQLALRILLTDLDEEQVVNLLSQSQDIFGDSDRFDLQVAMVQRLAHQNPSRALTRVLEMDFSRSRGGLVTSIYKDWAHSNLDEAVSYAHTLDQNLKRTALSAIVQERTDLSDDTIRAIARDLENEQFAISAIAQRKIEGAIDDPETAWNELAIDLQDDPSNARTISRVATAWVEKSGLSVLDQIYHSLTNTQTRHEVIRTVLVKVAQSDPGIALNYAQTLESNPHNSIVPSIASIWAIREPRSALAAAIGIEKAAVRKAATDAVLSDWAFREPRKLLEEIDALPADLQETASRAALGRLSRMSPKEAAELVAAMESGSIKTESARSVVMNWSHHYHREALEWILYEPGIEDIRSQLLSSIMNRLAGREPELAMSTALAQPIDEDKSGFGRFGPTGVGMELNVISSLAITDVDKAIELLPHVREGRTRDLAFQTVAQSLVMNDKIDKAFNVAQQVPDSDRERFFLLLSTSWAGTNPKSMLKSLDRFPTKESRSRAAVMLVGSNEYTQNLSDEQVEEARKYISDEHAKALEDGDPEGLQSIFQAL